MEPPGSQRHCLPVDSAGKHLRGIERPECHHNRTGSMDRGRANPIVLLGQELHVENVTAKPSFVEARLKIIKVNRE